MKQHIDIPTDVPGKVQKKATINIKQSWHCVQYIELLAVMLEFHTGALVQLLGVLLLVQLPTNVPERATEGGAPDTLDGDTRYREL